MLAKQRHDYILNELSIHGSVSVTQLTKQLHSSTATIRRDLQALEDNGLLIRVHGGAVSLVNETEENTFYDKVSIQSNIKQKVAKYVADKYIRDSMFIYLDAGSATHTIIPYLANRNITVVTNGVHHIETLLKHHISAVVLGGHIKNTTQAVVGSVALDQLSQYVFDICLLGVNSIDVTMGCSTPDEREAVLKRKARLQAKQTIVLADATKFNQQSRYTFAELNDVTVVSDNADAHYTTIERIT